jgi:hypothetical protein
MTSDDLGLPASSGIEGDYHMELVFNFSPPPTPVASPPPAPYEYCTFGTLTVRKVGDAWVDSRNCALVAQVSRHDGL